MPDVVEGPSYAPLSCGKATYLVVLLHGRGADGDDMIDIALNWQPIIPKAEFLAAHAPFPCENLARGRQWFNVEDRSPDKIFAGIRATAPLLDAFLDELLAKRRLDDSRLALVGFSQGAMMALHIGLRREKQIAGVVAFSGALHGVEALAAEVHSRPPVLLVHGEDDAVVPFSSLAQAKSALEGAGVPAKAVPRPGLGHFIDDEGVSLAGEFLSEILSRKKAEADQST